MPHVYPPEDPRSAASTFAPHQPGAGVVADDVEDVGDGVKASEASDKFADEPLPDTGPGPDRPGYKPLREMSDDEIQEAAGRSGEVPRGEGRKGKATRERDAKRREEAEKANKDAKPLSSVTADEDTGGKKSAPSTSSGSSKSSKS